ncbi:MAG: hypothetical protein MZV64_36290, partial [Ignavibacteriales bacterium]|nr:hypothetical protein [Ignavibacteriales bacterium]
AACFLALYSACKCQRSCSISGCMPVLGTAGEQHDQGAAVPRKIDPITRSPVDHVFPDPLEPLHVRGVARRCEQASAIAPS